MIEALRFWLVSTRLHTFVNQTIWVWPASETLHYFGLSILVGTVGLVDLRMLGMAKRLPFAAVHRLVPFGILGFILNICTGILFLAGAP